MQAIKLLSSFTCYALIARFLVTNLNQNAEFINTLRALYQSELKTRQCASLKAAKQNIHASEAYLKGLPFMPSAPCECHFAPYSCVLKKEIHQGQPLHWPNWVYRLKIERTGQWQ